MMSKVARAGRSLLLSSLLLSSAALAACAGGGQFQMGSGSSGSSGGGSTESSYGGPAEGSSRGGTTAAENGPAEPRWDDFAFAVRERTGTYYGPWIITKLTTFKVGKECWKKISEADSGAVNNASYYIRSVHELAKLWTGEDWDRIENQHSDRAKDRKFVEPLMDKFASQFHMTISVEGDDCEADRDAWWIRYWYNVAEAFAKYPPAAGKLIVNLNVGDVRDITVDVDESGSQFTITAPRDIEPKDWSEKLERPFRRVAKKL